MTREPHEVPDGGPLVRLYALTQGRARPAAGSFDLMAVVRATGTAPRAPLAPETRTLLERCRRAPATVADLASGSGLPLGVVRVLLGDLLAAGLIHAAPPASPSASRPDAHLLREVINGLRAL